MSTPDNSENTPPSQIPKKFPFRALLTILLAIVLLVSGLLLWSAVKMSSQEKKSEENKNLTTEETPTTAIPLPPEPAEIFSYSGNITKIEQTSIYINANVREGESYQEKTIKVNLNLISGDSHFTEIFRQDVSKISIPLPPGQEPEGPAYEPEQIDIPDLKVGDYITASDDENIKGKTEFWAEEIVVSFNSTAD